MRSKTKMILVIALVLSIVLPIAFFATLSQAYVNKTCNGDQDRDRIRSKDCKCNGDLLQMQDRDKLRTQNCYCDDDCAGPQYREGHRINEHIRNRICDCEMSLGRCRNQQRERTRSQELQ